MSDYCEGAAAAGVAGTSFPGRAGIFGVAATGGEVRIVSFSSSFSLSFTPGVYVVWLCSVCVWGFGWGGRGELMLRCVCAPWFSFALSTHYDLFGVFSLSLAFSPLLQPFRPWPIRDLALL